MEENKGIIEKIKEFFTNLFKQNKIKQIPAQTMRNDIDHSGISKEDQEKSSNEFKEHLADMENYTKGQKNNNEINVQEVIDSYNNYSFPANLNGYSFKTGLSLDHYINLDMNSYVCYLIKDGEDDLEEALPICLTNNKQKAKNIQRSLMNIKKNFNADYIENLKYVVYQIMPSKDYNLNSLLEELLNAIEYNEPTIKLPKYYKYQETPKGYEVVKTSLLIEKEKREEKIKNTNYEQLLRNYLINGKVDLKSLDRVQIEILKDKYEELIEELKSGNASMENFNLVKEYIERISQYDEKYSQLYNKYCSLESQYINKVNDNLKQIDLLRQQNQLKTMLINKFLNDKSNVNFDISDSSHNDIENS